ncbi:MAG: two-component system response regulator [Chlamydiae bacterium CG10_big_fil_rev_8_21_14_0_10_42_34]|nr:MAG: two-component system response regulator [Chlamydiae bacterium CG10_big_fil_rev_8_21_14_0_10_42_34]
MIEKVLVVDDEPLMLRFVSDVLKRQGKEVISATNGADAIRLLQQEMFDLIITDMKMPQKNGLDVLKAAKELYPSIQVILATAHGTIESAVDAMKMGAFNYLIKPFSPEALESIIEKAEEVMRLVKENTFYKEDAKRPLLVAKSAAMQKILQDIEKIAKAQASVFITGESGTGKEVIAGAIHELSSRSQHPFVKVNCAAIAETLLESEFFGHEKGSFTGAHVRKIGRFELADRGTLLLDEVTEIPLVLQPKLLRAIQEQEFERVGGTRAIKVNLRFLATSNRNMQEAIETKVFREDLFYRLNVVPIHIPPLRERGEDILPLANFFLEKFCRENHKGGKKLTDKAIQKLLDYPWPGNVRELANIIERTVVLDFDEEIDAEHLYLDSSVRAPKQQKAGITLHEIEKEHILQILEANHQNRTKTASMLGISVRTLRNKLQEYGN